MFLLAIGGAWLLDEISFGSCWLLVPFWLGLAKGSRPPLTAQSFYFPAAGSFLFFCALPVWFLVKEDLCSFLSCILCQAGLRYVGAVCWEKCWPGMEAEPWCLLREEMLQKHWNWVFYELAPGQRWRENISLMEILSGLSAKPSVGMGYIGGEWTL